MMDDQKILDNEVFEAVEVLDGEGLNLALTHYSKQLNAYMVRDESEWYSYCDKSGCLIDEYAQSDLRSLADIKELVELRKAKAELEKELNVTDELQTVLDFLLGVGNLEGHYFHDRPEDQGPNWWRAHLSEALKAGN
jgi:hypothetical protein